MDFGLSDDQLILQRSARDLLAKECPPAVVRRIAEGPSGHSEALDRRMAEMGWTGLLVPPASGGLGLGMLDMAILLAEHGRAAVPGPFLFSALLATRAIVRGADRRLKKQWLPKLASGECTATIALLEESGDSAHPAVLRSRARRKGAAYVLSGRKLFVPYAHCVDLLITACRTSGSDGPDGVTLFLVDRRASGLSIRPLETVDRTRRVCEVEMRRVEVPADQLLGRLGGGWPVIEHLLDLAAVGVAADGFGGAERVLEMAVEYAKTRQQFGRLIGSFQAIKHIAAEMVAEIEPARSLVWFAAYAHDALPREARRASSMAKAALSEIYSRCANRAVQIHGGIGFTWEHDVHFWFKRAKWNELAFGAPAFHRERVAALGGF
ncbi:MAG: acyl-CoA/acyl-ACP dehydrogenase [Deltaproteobacteria bacterium]|nr:acyl-CoA/acyl-ACP dehydrogenase [Deltaproteobacteria bacterium]